MAGNSTGHDTPLLAIRDLRVSVGDLEILKGVNLTVKAGEVHAIMGPNGSGKSTLASVLAGKPEYTVTGGEVLYEGDNLLVLEPEIRARRGVFLAFQYPLELPGVRAWQFLKAALDALRLHRGEEELGAREFDRLLKEKVKMVEIDPDLVKRAVNEGFSGGEKKRNEILQMAVFEPKLAVLDETDSGLDIDALRIVANGVNLLRSSANAIVLVTHYQRILNYITPDYVHVLLDGCVVRSGGPELAHELEARGYDWIHETADAGT
jgi:Fe-S cluster assembly ATP-binding protein